MADEETITEPSLDEEGTSPPINAPQEVGTLTDDPDYKRINQQLNDKWLERTGAEPLSAEHQDYLHDNVSDPSAPSLRRDTEVEFDKQFPEQAKKYAEAEKKKVYANIHDDPAYKKLQETISARVNEEVKAGSTRSTGQNLSASWDSTHMREQIHGMIRFARQYPEKAQGYTAQWDAFTHEHPEIASANNAKWETWCKEHPGALQSMNTNRDVAHALDHVTRRATIETLKPGVIKATELLNALRVDTELAPLPPTEETDTPLERDKSLLIELTLADVTAVVRRSIPAKIQSMGRGELEGMRDELAMMPYLPGSDVHEILNCAGEDEGVAMVDTDAIAGSWSIAFENWSTEYEQRKGRTVDVAQELIKGSPESVNHIFHISEPEDGIKLKKLTGPGGDLFFVIDGSHRVGGAKLAQLPELPAQVENMTNLSEIRTNDPKLKSQWEKRIEHGLIKGNIERSTTPTGEINYKLKIKSQVLPWMVLPTSKLIKLTRFYDSRYPGSLDKMKTITGVPVPKQALLDEVAMNFFLEGRWEEYETQNS